MPRHFAFCCRLCLSVVLWLLAGGACAQTLDELRLVSDGPDAVLQVRFNVQVQYLRYDPLEAADLVQVYFVILGGGYDVLSRPIEETLRLRANARVPGAIVSYPVQTALPVKKIVVHLDRKVGFRVRPGANNQVLEIVLPGLAPGVPGAAAPVVERDRYALLLQSVPIGQREQIRAIPAQLQDYTVFGTQQVRDGRSYFDLVLGYFDSRAAAQKVLARALAQFPDAAVIDLVERKQANLQQAAQAPGASVAQPEVPPARETAPATTAAAAAAAAVAKAPESELDRQAADLMAQARAALLAGKQYEAINWFNQLLLLPPNKYSQDAQELIGLARERAGESEQARKEYELYLRLFPTGDGATRVRQRLAALAPPQIATAPAGQPPSEQRAPRVSATGSISQYYYGGDQKVLTIFNVPTTVNQQTLTNNTQSSLVSTVDLTGRYRTDTDDTRIVFRDADQHSFIAPTAPSINRLDAAYLDYRDLKDGLSARLGRQSGVTGGLIGRFDGAVLSYDVVPKLRLSAVAGVPVSQDEFVNASQRFEGLSIEAQNIADHWGGDVYAINQTAQGVVDRRAVGAEARYFDQNKTLYSLVDYDVEFAVLNAATLQGTYQFADLTSVSLLLDDRKAPTLETSNGLLRAGCSSYAQYFAGQCPLSVQPYTVQVLRQDALAITANTHQFALDVARPFGASWQLATDLRVSSVGALPTVTINGQTFQGTSATGNVFGATLQATGANLYSRRDTNVFSVTRLQSQTLHGDQLAYNNLNGLFESRLTLEPNVSLYREVDATGQRLIRIAPGLRTSFRLTTHMSLEGTVSMERSRNYGPAQNDTTTNVFYYVGYRYDLNYH